MMARSWNNEQRQAIEARGQNIVVSAGAGSGKTAVLTERVFRLIEQGFSLDQLLVLTFTNAAANEMKERIRSRLVKEFPSAAMRVESARIMTFDAFALALVKKYHYVLGLEKDIDIIDESLLDYVRKKALDDIFAFHYEQGDLEFLHLINTYATRDDKKLQSLVENVDRVADLKIDKIAYFDHYIDHYYSDSFIEKGLSDFIELVEEEFVTLIDAAKAFSNSDMMTAVISYFARINDITDVDTKIAAIITNKFPDKIRGKLLDEEKALHDFIKQRVQGLQEWASIIASSNYAKTRYLATKNDVTTIVNIARELHNRLMSFKQEKQLFSFSDVAKFAIKLVENPLINKELKREIRHLMIDEYQDTNDLQDYFINLLAQDNVYVVGDIKQSIYRFRNANCDIFAQKYADYRDSLGGRAIDMNTNYRSRAEVIDAINDVFSHLMSPKIGGADYLAHHQIHFGQTEYNLNGKVSQDVGLIMYGYEREMNIDPIETEINIIADDIVSKMQTKQQVYDKKLDVLRPIQFNDFAILIDRKASFSDFQRIFNAEGIPLDVELIDDFHESDVLNVFENLIRLVAGAQEEDFPLQHLHEWASVMRSFIFQTSDAAIHQTIMAFKEKTIDHDPLVDEIRNLAFEAKTTSLQQTLINIAIKFDLHHKVIALGDVNFHAHRIDQLIKLGASIEKMGQTMTDLVIYFDESTRLNAPLALESLNQGEQAVHLMTIHKSKGLEFPVVYYPGFAKRFNHPEEKTSMLAHGHYGIVLPIYDKDTTYTLFHFLVRADEKQQALSEEMRKLYVALTRSEEAMIMIYDQNDGRPFTLSGSKSFHDFMAFGRFFERYGHKYIFKNVELRATEDGKTPPSIEFKHVNIATTPQIKERASATPLQVDQTVLEFGVRLHEIMSRIDYQNLNLDFIASEDLKAHIRAIIKLPPLSDARLAKVFQEQAYVDNASDTLGMIDLMLEFENEIRIIDFKTSSLDHIEYDRQMKMYYEIIAARTKKPIRLYLISLMRHIYREVSSYE